jgi:hypothetical protein
VRLCWIDAGTACPTDTFPPQTELELTLDRVLTVYSRPYKGRKLKIGQRLEIWDLEASMNWFNICSNA